MSGHDALDAFWRAHCAAPCAAVVRAALAEDLGASGDITSALAMEARGRHAASMSLRLVPREDGVVAGMHAAAEACAQLGASWSPAASDGSPARRGVPIAEVSGPAAAALSAERTLLNLVGILSGTATLTAAFVEAVRGTRARICDTRKTIPGLRALQKHAVLAGGGLPHRMGLHDAFLAKDNHLAGLSPAEAAALVRQCSGPARARGAAFVMCEADSLAQVDALLALEPGILDIILLDNFPLDAMAEAVRRRDRAAAGVQLEASGGITLGTAAGVARTGVDRISVGALTHSARSLDVGLDAP